MQQNSGANTDYSASFFNCTLVGGSGVKLHDGADLKLYFSWFRVGTFCLLLGPSGFNWCFFVLSFFLLLWISVMLFGAQGSPSSGSLL